MTKDDVGMHRVEPTIDDMPQANLMVLPAFAVYLGPLSYRLAWGGIYFVHALCAFYCFGAALLFREAPKNYYMIFVFTYFQTTLDQRYYPTIATVHWVVGAIHSCFVIEPVIRAISDKCKLTPRNPSRTGNVFINWLASIPQTLAQRIPCPLKNAVQLIYASVFAREGLLGIESHYYDTLLLVREAIECGLQANQAYQMCQQLPRQWLNRLFVGTLIVNCSMTLVLHKIISNKPLLRVLERVCDVILDFLASVGVPLALVVSYGQQYDLNTHTFPSDLWDDEVWSARIQTESPLVFFGSWMDAISRLLFALGLLLSLDDIKMLLRKQHTKISSVYPHGYQIEHKHTVSVSSRILHIGHCWLFAFGMALLGIHLHSEFRTAPKACLLELRPWFLSKPTCVVVEFSCYTNRNYSGFATEFDLVFANLNPLPLVHVSFRHCHAIEFTSSIQQFPNLLDFKMYNTTILAWEENAALTNTSHPQLSLVQIIRTNFLNGMLPPGLASHGFPCAVTTMAFSITNLRRFPEDLSGWPPLNTLVVEFGLLNEYPIAFTRIGAITIQLVGNVISELPREAFEAPGPSALILNGNPIARLPENANLSTTLGFIQLYSTNISAIPMWLVEAATERPTIVAVGRTPYCENLASGRRGVVDFDTSESSFSSEADLESSASEETGGGWGLIDCTDFGPVVSGLGVVQGDENRSSEVW